MSEHDYQIRRDNGNPQLGPASDTPETDRLVKRPLALRDAIIHARAIESKLTAALAQFAEDKATLDWLDDNVIELHLTLGRVINVDYAPLRPILDAARKESTK